MTIDGTLWCGDERPDACGVGAVRAGRAVSTATCVEGSMMAEDLAALNQPVDLNRATPEALASLPGIGPALAARIVEARPFDRVDAVVDVRGIGPAKLEAMRPRARVSEPRSR